MVNDNRNDEINIAKTLPWITLIFLIVFMFYLWPSGEDSKSATNVSSESSETVAAETNDTADENKSVAEILDLLNFRNEPNDAKTSIIGTVNKGEKFKIVEQQEKWLKIEKSDGNTGYITTDPKYVKIVSE